MAKQTKRFLDSIGAALRENVVEEIMLERKVIPKRKLGFLDMLDGGGLDSEALEVVMPSREMVKRQKEFAANLPSKNIMPTTKVKAPIKRSLKTVEYSAEIYTELLEKLRDIASFRKISINELFNQALNDYTEKYWNITMSSDE